MKKYTLEDFKTFERIDGKIICPTGDYTLIESFPNHCSFGKLCSFGVRCSFGKLCSFGEWCSFGKLCSFGVGGSFGKLCSFGEWCSFGKLCSFEVGGSFGFRCSFGERCIYCLFEFDKIICLYGFLSYSTIIYFNDSEYYISVGCMNFATLEELKEEAIKRNKYDESQYQILKMIIENKLGV